MKKDKDYLCAFEYGIDKINGKWKGKILKHLHEKTYRFNELHRAIPNITVKMLSMVLKELVNDKIILKKIYPVIPPKVEYKLSENGKELEKIFIDLSIWGEKLALQNNLTNIKCDFRNLESGNNPPPH